jgi:hypothetical protein
VYLRRRWTSSLGLYNGQYSYVLLPTLDFIADDQVSM